jgi:predicted Zn-dependent protease
MKRVFTPFVIACAALTLTACQKDAKEAAALPDAVSADALASIQRMGFSTDGIQKVSGGYLVEGDIMLHDADLSRNPSSPNLFIAQEEQYRTFNLVNATSYPVIKVALNNSSATHEAAFSAALDEAIRRYNAENLTISFQRVTTGADITVVAYHAVDNTLGSAGFPSSTGAPYSQIKMNTYHYSTSTSTTNTNYIGSIIAHEVGHCIGMRHTDYMNRAYSCGGRRSNEGQANNGVGAVHIPGTPTAGDPNSWMLACIGSNVNRPFNGNDKIALSTLY